MDAQKASRNAWLCLLGIPVAWFGGAILGMGVAAASGLEEGARASAGLALLVIVVLALVWAIAAAVAVIFGRRAVKAGVQRAMLPAWLVIGSGALAILQNVVAYLLS